jgi:hypothetical protein
MKLYYPQVSFGRIVMRDVVSKTQDLDVTITYPDHGKYYWDDKKSSFFVMYMVRTNIFLKKFTVYRPRLHKRKCGFRSSEGAYNELQKFLKNLGSGVIKMKLSRFESLPNLKELCRHCVIEIPDYAVRKSIGLANKKDESDDDDEDEDDDDEDYK